MHKAHCPKFFRWEQKQLQKSNSNALPKGDIRNYTIDTNNTDSNSSITNSNNNTDSVGYNNNNTQRNNTNNTNNQPHQIIIDSNNNNKSNTPLAKKPKQNPQQRRRRYQPSFKARVIAEYIELLKSTNVLLDDKDNVHDSNTINVSPIQDVIANKYGFNRCLVSKWYDKRDDLFKHIADLGITKSKLVTRVGNVRGALFPSQEAELRKIFSERRLKGRKISALWFKLQFKRLLQRDKPDGYDRFKYSRGWFEKFCSREPRIVVRKTTNKKHIDIKDRVDLIHGFHQYMHDIRTTTEYSHQSDEYGRFKPENTGHFDEIPAPFVFGASETYEFEGVRRVHVSQPGNALDKRQYTVSLFFNGGAVQYTPPQVIFRGKGLGPNIRAERAKYAKGLLHTFQQSAWQTGDTMIDLLRHYRNSKTKHGVREKTLLVMDNLECHKSNRTKNYAGRYANTLLAFTPPNCTDTVSVVDQLAFVWKKLLQHEYESWADANFNKWQENKTSAGDRRILFSTWVSTAWNKMKQRTDLINRMFQKTGIILKKNGSDKHMVKVAGVDDYKVPF